MLSPLRKTKEPPAAPSVGTWTERNRRTVTRVVLASLGTSFATLALAPLFMSESYSWIEHAVSASAGQGVENAWLARLGFLLLAFAVLLLAGIAGERWGAWGRLAHRVYGMSVIAAAAFSQSHWEDVPFDAVEDFLHSAAVFGAAFGFIVGVLIVRLRRGPDTGRIRLVDLIAVIAAMVVPIVMFNFPDVAGAVERVMFLIAYLWYGMEAQRVLGKRRATS